jgi:hypothetical protein
MPPGLFPFPGRKIGSLELPDHSALLDRKSGKGVVIVARVMNGFLNVTDRLRFFFGPATGGDMDTPVVHKHDEFERASEEELSHFEVETDSHGHHYAVRKDGK